MVAKHHFHPKPINDTLSENVFKLFLQNINIKKQLFIQSELDTFEADRLKLDNYIENENCEFLSKYTTALESRMQTSKLYLNSLKTTPLDYSGKDTLYFDAKRVLTCFKNNGKAEKYWRKKNTHNILKTIIEDSTDLEYINLNFKRLEKGVKEKV